VTAEPEGVQQRRIFATPGPGSSEAAFDYVPFDYAQDQQARKASPYARGTFQKWPGRSVHALRPV
jgi:hypothetical protein